MSELSFVVWVVDQTVGILQFFPPELAQSILGLQLPLHKAIFNPILKLSYNLLSTYYGSSALLTTDKLQLSLSIRRGDPRIQDPCGYQNPGILKSFI